MIQNFGRHFLENCHLEEEEEEEGDGRIMIREI